VSGGLARASVFGINDGLVSNVSLILGFAASGVDTSVVQLAGIAGAIAGGISMAAGEWISVTAQNDLIRRELEVEQREHIHNRAHETEELAEVYIEQGLDPELAMTVAEKVMENPVRALEVHARQELGVDPAELPSAPWAASLSLVCFLFGAILPIIPWFLSSGTTASVISVSVGVVAAAIVGALIGRFAERSLLKSIIRQVGIVLLACAVTFIIGQSVGVNLD
jgi:VIT1/CCC1 family predicted Fe2+/Mn2+ transporter